MNREITKASPARSPTMWIDPSVTSLATLASSATKATPQHHDRPRTENGREPAIYRDDPVPAAALSSKRRAGDQIASSCHPRHSDCVLASPGAGRARLRLLKVFDRVLLVQIAERRRFRHWAVALSPNHRLCLADRRRSLGLLLDQAGRRIVTPRASSRVRRTNSPTLIFSIAAAARSCSRMPSGVLTERTDGNRPYRSPSGSLRLDIGPRTSICVVTSTSAAEFTRVKPAICQGFTKLMALLF